jgi:hypothetical protein
MFYMKEALRSLGHTVWSAGTFDPTIPWAAEMDFTRFIDTPDYETPSDLHYWEAHDVLLNCPFKPDALISVDAAYYLVNANKIGVPNICILTDPHALPAHYKQSIEHYDKVACMQQCYSRLFETTPSGRSVPVWWLPYAADPKRHYWNGTDFSARPVDAMILSGLMYRERQAGFDALGAAGLVTYQEKGILYEDASEAYGQSVMAYSWSSQQDLCARFFESLAMRTLTITNRVPDLKLFSDLQEDVHYIAYDSVDELVDKSLFYARNRDAAWKVASAGYGAWWAGSHSWTQRMSLVLDVLVPKE